ncbi:MAG: DnaT-like ssDNA-binding domain-containing protein, partial [Pseudomonadales bacterium]|nr:DnaT-like ssDNA-binding domain-containing protein [Pseudomonadales bacterium]
DAIDKANLNQSNGSGSTNQSGQIDPIRLGQSDLMITENTTEITTEREALPVIAPPNLFAMDTTANKKFPMTESWQPTEKFGDQCKFRNVNLSALALDDQEDLINEFRSYWMTQDTQLNQSGWEHKLIGSLKRSQERKSGTGRNPQSFKGGKFSSAHGDMNW